MSDERGAVGADASTTGGLLRSSAFVAVGTGLSRVSGLARTIVVAYALGGALLASSYNLANTTPNIVYELILGGILSATLVPVIVERFDRHDDEAIDALATVITIVLAAVTVLAVLAAPVFITFYTRFGVSDSEAAAQRSVALPLLFLFMPQIFFYGVSALWTALLNARRSFAVPAFAPVLNNVIVIAVLIGLVRWSGTDLTFEAVRDDPTLIPVLGIGTTAGIVAMTLVLWPAMRRAGIRLHVRADWRHPAVRAVARLSGWMLGYVAANQIVFVLMLALLNGLPGERAVAGFSYAWQFVQLPMGLFAVSIITTFAPDLALHASRGDIGAYRQRFLQGLRLTVLVVLPAAVLLVVLATPIVTVALARGSFDASDVEVTATALAWLAVGLPGLAVFVFSIRGLFAFQDTRRVFWLGLVESVVQIGLSFALVGPYGLRGVMAAFSVATTLAAVLALLVIRSRAGDLAGALPDLARKAGAATVMVAAVIAVVTSQRLGGGLVELVVGSVVGLCLYVGVLTALRDPDLAAARSIARRGLRR